MQDYSLKDKPAPPPDALPENLLKSLDKLSETQLMELRHELDMRLQISIEDLNLTEEISLQYRQAKALLSRIQNDVSTPANQLAQVFNTTQAQLEKIIKQRAQIFNQERLKRYESAMLAMLEQCVTNEQKEKFLEMYGEFLKSRGD